MVLSKPGSIKKPHCQLTAIEGCAEDFGVLEAIRCNFLSTPLLLGSPLLTSGCLSLDWSNRITARVKPFDPDFQVPSSNLIFMIPLIRI